MTGSPPAASGPEKRLKGVPVSHGVGIGPLFPLAESVALDVSAYYVLPHLVEDEIERLRTAIEHASNDLRGIRDEAAAKVGEDESRIFMVHLEVLADRSLQKQLEQAIRGDAINAEAAVSKVILRYAEAFEKLGDPLARDRASDIRDVGRRILKNLSVVAATDGGAPDIPYVLVTKELLPSDAAQLDRRRLAGIITEVGGKASHAAILARALGIPAVTGIADVEKLVERGGVTTIVDGREGDVVLDPTPESIQQYLGRAAVLERMREALADRPALPAVTRDGVAVDILVNVENPGEVMPTDMTGLAGIGLYRTEFVYMNRNSFPSEDEQFAVYRDVLSRCEGKEVVFRTIDIGGDKRLPYFRVAHEDNPALGWRGFRVSDEWPDMFIAQLRALLRASAFGRVSIMLPMITTVEEVRRGVAIFEDVRAELARRKIACAPKVPLGIMVEVPAAAVAIDLMLKEVDFVSIGSNDLIQYLLAADRNNARVSALSQPLNPSVLRTVRSVVKAGIAANKPVSLCGEMAGSFYSTLVLLGMGLRRFSMARHYVQGVGRLIQAVTITEAEAVARRALSFATAGEVRAFVQARTMEIFKGIGVAL